MDHWKNSGSFAADKSGSKQNKKKKLLNHKSSGEREQESKRERENL